MKCKLFFFLSYVFFFLHYCFIMALRKFYENAFKNTIELQVIVCDDLCSSFLPKSVKCTIFSVAVKAKGGQWHRRGWQTGRWTQRKRRRGRWTMAKSSHKAPPSDSHWCQVFFHVTLTPHFLMSTSQTPQIVFDRSKNDQCRKGNVTLCWRNMWHIYESCVLCF